MYFKIIVATLSILVVSCNGDKPEPEEYLPFKRLDKDKEFGWVIKRIDSGDWGSDLETLVANLKPIKTLTQEASLHGVGAIKDFDKFKIGSHGEARMEKLNVVIENLLSFINHNPLFLECNNNQVLTFIGLVNLKFGTLKKFRAALEKPPRSLLFEFLHRFGPKHVRECLELITDAFKVDLKLLNRETELKLDTLVALGQKIAPEKADLRLVAKAQDLDLARGKFEGMKMFSLIAKRFLSNEEQKKGSRAVTSGRLLAEFIGRTCADLRAALLQIDMYNLARIMTPEAVTKLKMPAKFKKLNEYSRICIPFSSQETRRFAELNVERNVKRV